MGTLNGRTITQIADDVSLMVAESVDTTLDDDQRRSFEAYQFYAPFPGTGADEFFVALCLRTSAPADAWRITPVPGDDAIDDAIGLVRSLDGRRIDRRQCVRWLRRLLDLQLAHVRTGVDPRLLRTWSTPPAGDVVIHAPFAQRACDIAAREVEVTAGV